MVQLTRECEEARYHRVVYNCSEGHRQPTITDAICRVAGIRTRKEVRLEVGIPARPREVQP